MSEFIHKLFRFPLQTVLSVLLLLYLALYFLVPYKPWDSPVSFHMPLLGLGLLVCLAQCVEDFRAGKPLLSVDLLLFSLAVVLFVFSSSVIHFNEFSRVAVQAYVVSFLCFFFVRMSVKNLDPEVLLFWMKTYLLVSGMLIICQINFAGHFYVAGFFGQTNFGKGTQGWGFANTHILAGGSIAWVLSVVFSKYAMVSKEKLPLRSELFYLSALALGSAGLFYTLNRGAWLAMLMAVLFLAFILLRASASPLRFARGLAAMCIFVVALHMDHHQVTYKMSEKLDFMKTVSVNPGATISGDAASLTRLKAWGVAVDGIIQNPFWGLGVGQYPEFYSKAFPNLFKGISRYGFDDNPRQIPHNSYLYYATETGIVPAVFLFVFIGYIILAGFCSGASWQGVHFLVGLVAICSWIFTCDFINERIFWIALGIVAGLLPYTKPQFFSKSR